MEIEYLRSSSMNTWNSYCEMKYYFTYCLGKQETPNLKAEMGTVVHALLEVLAGLKESFDKNGICEYEHPGIGLVTCSRHDLYEVSYLKDEEVDIINKARRSKDIYRDQIKVEYGQQRIGVAVVNRILKELFNYYSEKSPHDWGNLEYSRCLNWAWMALDWMDGEFDPRNRKIIYPEYPFNIEIKQPWAKIDSNKYLRIKGTIDLVTDVGDNTIEIIDWKTGRRHDWGKDKPKEYEDLMKDEQLMLYYYAARKSFVNYDNIMLTIFFIRDGGPFSLPFDDSVLPIVENRLRETYESIRNCKDPELLDRFREDFRCKRLCDFCKKEQPGTGISQCEFMKKEIKTYGIEKTSKKHRQPGFSVGYYHDPGS